MATKLLPAAKIGFKKKTISADSIRPNYFKKEEKPPEASESSSTREILLGIRDFITAKFKRGVSSFTMKRKEKQKERREARERNIENKEKKFKLSNLIKPPKTIGNIFSSITNFLLFLAGGILFNVLGLEKSLTAIEKTLEIIGKGVQIFANIVGMFTNFIDSAVKGYDEFLQKIEDVTGFDKTKIEKFMEDFKYVINGAIIASIFALRALPSLMRRRCLPNNFLNKRNLKIEGRRTRFSNPDYRARVDQRYRQRYGSNIPANKIPQSTVVDQPRPANIFERIQRSFTPDPLSTPLKSKRNFLGIDWGKKVGQVKKGFQGGMKKVSEFGDVAYRNTIGKIDEQLKKLDPGTVLKNLSKGDGPLAKGAQRMLGFFDSPLTRKILNKAPFIGDAIVFLIDLATGKHWVRALLRTIGAIGLDAGFYGLTALTLGAAPFTGGMSLTLSAALVGAYMAADAAAGAALGSEGVGQFIGDWVADKLGVPKMGGEKGSGKWKSLFGGGGKINSSQESVEKLMEGVKLSQKEIEAISKVPGGLGDPDSIKQEKILTKKGKLNQIKAEVGDKSKKDIASIMDYADYEVELTQITNNIIQPIKV